MFLIGFKVFLIVSGIIVYVFSLSKLVFAPVNQFVCGSSRAPPAAGVVYVQPINKWKSNSLMEIVNRLIIYEEGDNTYTTYYALYYNHNLYDKQ